VAQGTFPISMAHRGVLRRTGRPAAEVARELVELELAGLVCAHDGLYRVQ